jgi:Ca2+-binding RTX toxin-like protein
MGRIQADLENKRDTKLEDWLNLAGNIIAICAAVGETFTPAGRALKLMKYAAKAVGAAQVVKWGSGKAHADEISTATNTNFLAAPKAAPLRRDPLILDLDNDGLETIGIDTARPILFDHTGTGLKTASGWVTPDDAFLVIDRNGNGRIDSGRELFGDATPLEAGGSATDGFAALAQEDSNHDGQVTAADARWADLRLWRDLNQDGLTQSDELSTLDDHGITALNVAQTSHSTLLDNGNQIADLGGFLRSDGRIGTLGEVEQLEQLADINLISNPFYSEFTDTLPLTDAAQRLPDMQGAGKVRDLRQAASLQTPAGQALVAALDTFAAAPTRSEQMNQLDDLLKAWAATSTMATTASGAFDGVDLRLSFAGVTPDSPAWQAWLDKLSILERFNGQTFLPVPAAGTTLTIDIYSTREALLDAAYMALKDSVYGALVLQTRLKPYLDAVSLTIDESGIKLDFSGVEAAMDTLHASDPANALIDRIDLFRYAGNSLGASGWDAAEKINAWVEEALQGGYFATVKSTFSAAFSPEISLGDDFYLGTGDAETLNAMAGNDMVFAGGGNDVVYGDAGNDYLNGGAGVDTLYCGEGDDTLDGGAGDDFLMGNAGNDTYVFGRGRGHDTLIAYDTTAGRIDTLRLEGLNPSDIRLEKWNGADVGLVIVDTGEWINLQGYLNGSSYQLNAIKFADGTIWDQATLLAQAFNMFGTPGNDSLTGANGISNSLYGYAGNDNLNGGSGNDILDGGADDDYLRGNAGNDTYVFGRGSGHDTLIAYDITAGRIDTLLLEGLNPSDIRLEKWNGADVGLVIVDTGEWINLQGYLNGSSYQLNAIKFADGTIWDQATLLAQAFNMFGTPGNDSLTGANGIANRLYGYAGNDNLNGGSGNDILDGGAGDDYLRGNAGNDTYVFGRGSGHDTLIAYDITAGRVDTLRLEGLNPSDIRLEKWNGADVGLVIVATGEWINLQGYLNGSSYQLNAIKFADGTVWDQATLLAQAFNMFGTPGNDTLTGANGIANRLYGYAGNDNLNGGSGNDILDGGADDDYLRGNAGNDTLDGGAGDDFLMGNAGNDTYVFGRGSGHDTLIAYDTTAGRIDTLLLEGLNPSDIRLEKWNGADVGLVIVDTGEWINLQGYLNGSTYQLNAVKFADGTIWDQATLLAQAFNMFGTPGNDNITGANGIANRLYGYAGNDNLYGGDGNDSLDGGADDDYLKGNAGNDTYIFGRGSGHDTLNAYDTTAGRIETLILEGLNPSDIRMDKWNGADVGLVIVDTGEWINLQGYLNGSNYQLNAVKFADGTVWDQATLLAQAMFFWGTSANNNLTGRTEGRNALYGLDGNDTLTGAGFNDLLDGGAGNDTLNGGTGNDTLHGGAGDDSYAFRKGDGVDAVSEGEGATSGSADTVRFIDVKSTEVSAVRQGSTLVLDYGTTDQLTINGQFADGASVIEHISFSDGVVWDQAGIEANLRANDSTGDKLPGEGAAALDSDLPLIGDAGDNLLDGGAGQDTLYGGAGHDTLIGGTGNDLLYGGRGNDSYLFSQGDGVDSISEGFVTGYGPGGGAVDTVRFLDVRSSEVNALRRGSSLVLDYGANDQVTIEGQFAGGAHAIERITFSDGVSWNKAAIRAHAALLGTAGDDVLRGGRRSDRIYGLDGNDTLYGKAGKDLLDGGAGNDSLYGGSGNDILDGGAGDDSLSDTAGKAVFNGGAGNDTLTGGSRAELYLGGAGNDTCTTGGGKDVILFNKGDGQDSVAASSLHGDTLSLGGDFAYSDLGLRKSANDLVLSMGEGDQIIFQDWYAKKSSRPALKLQVIAEAMAGFAAGGSDPLLDQKVERFNFSGLVKAFDAARTARTAPALNAWSLTEALLKVQLAGSDSAAIGGELAYQYGKNGSVSGLSLTATQEVINDSHFGRQAQALQPLAELPSPALRMA